MSRFKYYVIPFILGFAYFFYTENSNQEEIKNYPIDYGWSQNSINTVIFRNNAVTSNDEFQFVAYYDTNKHVVLAKRNLDSDIWEIKQTRFTGNAYDAHNCISIALDGDGYLHMAWDHHNTKLKYVKSISPNIMDFCDETMMTDSNEYSVSYPEFYNFPNGDLLFLYRDGESGKGNLEVNIYDIKTKTWSKRISNLIDGEGERNAYWQTCIDQKGTIHLSWNWRETWDVSSNHDLCYAQSDDKGVTWKKSNGARYTLPITLESAEYVARIPRNSNLINQTTITTDNNYNPLVATYYSPDRGNVPQFILFKFNNILWEKEIISKRKLNFNLGGGGTKRIPISRPKLLSDYKDNLYLIFRDEEQENRISLLKKEYDREDWEIINIIDNDLGAWEPNYDKNLWDNKNTLDLFVQKVGQGDGEKLETLAPQIVSVLRWQPN